MSRQVKLVDSTQNGYGSTLSLRVSLEVWWTFAVVGARAVLWRTLVGPFRPFTHFRQGYDGLASSGMLPCCLPGGIAWLGSAWPLLTWPVLAWRDFVWYGVVWVWLGFAWLGSARLGLTRLSLWFVVVGCGLTVVCCGLTVV